MYGASLPLALIQTVAGVGECPSLLCPGLSRGVLVHFLRLSVVWSSVRAVVVLVVFVPLLVLLSAFFGPILDVGASPAWVDQASPSVGYGPYVCNYEDGSCNGDSATDTLTGPAVLSLSAADDASGDDVELGVGSVMGPGAGSDPCNGVTIVTPSFDSVTSGSFPTSCDLSSGDSVELGLGDYGPYTSAGDTDCCGTASYTPAVAPDVETALFSGGSLALGGGGSGDVVSSAFVGTQSLLLTDVAAGVIMVIAVLAAGLGVWLVWRWSRRAVSAA